MQKNVLQTSREDEKRGRIRRLIANNQPGHFGIGWKIVHLSFAASNPIVGQEWKKINAPGQKRVAIVTTYVYYPKAFMKNC